MPLSPVRWTLLGLASVSLLACSGGADQAGKPATPAAPAATAKNDTQMAAKAGPDPSKLIERFDANKDGVLEVAELPKRLQRWLGKADANNDGKLGSDELRAHAESMKKEHFARLDDDKDGSLTESEVGDRRWKRLSQVDENKDGKVTLAEIDTAIASGKPGFFGRGFGPGGPGKRDPGRRFQKMDSNGDGRLTQDEVGDKRWSHLSAADENKDGKVTKDELKSAHQSGKLAPKMKPPKPDLDDDGDDQD